MKKEVRTNREEYVVIAGAGISMAAPANLPSWWQYNKKIVDEIKKQACDFCPEAVEWINKIDIGENGIAVQCLSELIVNEGAGDSYFTLLELLNAKNPNANHFALAELARKGCISAIVTTNFDTLIETAFMSEAVPIYTIVNENTYYESSRWNTCKLFKIHGTVDSYNSLIDTVRQKAMGLNSWKRFSLKQVFSGRDIIVIGFSGTDLDFDLDYIPIAQAIQGGSKVTWVIRPGTVLNHNVKILMEQYPGSVNLYTGELSSLFEALGVDYKKINNNLGIALGEDTEALIEKKIRELFTSEHIGPHGCIGYCISLLEMMGASDEASKIAAIYEKKIDLSDVNIFSVLGLNALARRKMHEAKFEESKQYYQAVLDCFQYMNKLAEEITGSENKMVNQDLEAAAKKERQVNTAMIYNNLGLISFYRNEFNEAEKLFTNAKEIIESTNSNKHLDVISFNIARTNYKRDKDYDKYLLLLKQSAMYAKKTGNLHTLVEILVEECKIRLEIGEYYLAQHSLNEIEDHTKNIGDFRTHINAGILKAQYFLRTGERNKSLQCLQKLIIFIENRNDQFCAMHLLSKIAEMYSYNNEIAEQIDRLCDISNTDAGKIKEAWKQQIDKTEEAECFLPYFIVETLPNDDDRKVIIQLEYKKEKRWLSKFFLNLCIKYVTDKDWERLEDVAKCYCTVANMDNDKSIANYYLGCSAMEKQNYSDAVQYFDNVIRFGEKANQIYLGWAYIECGKLYMRKGVFEESKRYYYIGKDILLKQDSEEEMLNASLTFVKTLYDENQLKEAMRCTSELLTEINDLKLRERVEKSYKELLDVETKKSSTKDFNIENACPEEIAMEAQRLHENPEKREVAWKLIKLAKEKYKKNGNIAGVGRCENNMGCFCISENKGLDAVGYFKKALDIKKSLGDVKGVINQIVGILFLYINNSDMKSAEQVVAYALNLLPQYEYVAEKYSLFFVLTIYYFKQQHFAEALYYGKLAEKGLPYLRETGRLRAEMLSEILVQIEKLFDTKRVSVSTHSDYFEAELAEATRLFKIGKFQECCNMLEELSKETGEDYFRQGQIKGTLANACLHEKHYEDALTNFMAAKSLFDTLQEKGNNDIREHFYTVLNGATIALDGLGRVDESIELLRRELEINNQTKQGRFSLTISLCNRLLTARREEIKKGTQLFEEILERLNAQKIDELSHEKRGIVYCAFGNLYNVVSDKTIAKEYYQLAKEEFLISNSPHISAVEQMLKSI